MISFFQQTAKDPAGHDPDLITLNQSLMHDCRGRYVYACSGGDAIIEILVSVGDSMDVGFIFPSSTNAVSMAVVSVVLRALGVLVPQILQNWLNHK